MTVTLELEPEVESLLEKRARAEGCDVKGYVEKLVERDVNRERRLVNPNAFKRMPYVAPGI